MAKTLQELQVLDEARTRIGKWLDYICGISNDIDSLPRPRTRIEEQLEYIALNLVGGQQNGQSSPIDANNIQFTEGSTGLGTNVQTAIERVNTKVNQVPSSANDIQFTDNNTGLGNNVQTAIESVNNKFNRVPSTASQLNFTEGNTGLGTNIQTAIENVNNKFSECSKLNEENTFTQNTIFEKDILLKNNNIFVGEYNNGTQAGGNKRIGRRDFTSHSNNNNGYVKSLVIKCSSGIQAGNRVDVSIWAVQKKDTDLVDSDIEKIVSGQTTAAKIYNSKWGMCFEVEINRLFIDEVFFVFQLDNSSTDRTVYVDKTTNNNNYIYLEDSYTNVDASTLNRHSSRYVGVYGIVGKYTSIRSSLGENDISSYMITQNRLLLTNRYATDTVGFNVNAASTISVDDSSQQYDNDLYNLIFDNIKVGKNNMTKTTWKI
jgi:hypothetical protein